jgi:peptidyl-dipeptidase Dcp
MQEIVMRHRIPQFGHIFQAMDMLQGITAIYGLDVARMREALPKETDHMTKKSRRGFTNFLAWNTTDQEDAYRSFRDVTPRVMLS